MARLCSIKKFLAYKNCSFIFYSCKLFIKQINIFIQILDLKRFLLNKLSKSDDKILGIKNVLTDVFIKDVRITGLQR